MALKLPLSRLSGRMAFACLLLGTAPAAYAAPLDSILSCRQIEDAQARLACFDAAAATLSQDVETGVVVAVEGVEIEAVERDGFGLRRGSPSDSAEQPAAREREGALASAETSPDARVVERREDGQIQMIELVIDRVSTHGYNTTRFHMTNDQIWEVTDTMSVNVPRVRRGEVLNAEIRRAGAGGFFLRINGEGRAMRVRRLE